jgi:eukaryotic-like serine/threonine-protein kinase
MATPCDHCACTLDGAPGICPLDGRPVLRERLYCKDPRVGRLLRSYRIERVLGRGGFGTVYLGSHPDSGEQVAIKIPQPEVQQRPRLIRQFVRTGRIVRAIRHHNLVAVRHIGMTDGDTWFLVMDYVRGRSLGEVVLRGAPQRAERVRHIGRQLASALHALHLRGLVYRDLKPPNVLLTVEHGELDVVKLLDFGLVGRLVGGAGPTVVAGTTGYQAPELFECAIPSISNDIYGLGVLLLELATGTPAGAIWRLGLLTEPGAPVFDEFARRAPIDPALAPVLRRCVLNDPAARFQSMAEVAEALGES